MSSRGTKQQKAGGVYGRTVQNVEDRLRGMIISGELKPGDHVRQDHIADGLGTTRVPIREAFKTLVSEGLLRHEPNRGHFIATMSANELTQVYWMRGVLEDRVAETADAPTAEILEQAEEINRAIESHGSNGSVMEVAVANRQLHFLLFNLSPLSFVVGEVERLWDRTDQYRAVYLHEDRNIQRIISEHDAIIDALAAGDQVRYLQLLAEHRNRGMEEVLNLLDESVDGDGAPAAAKA